MKAPVEVCCASCGEMGKHSGRRLCRPCYRWHHRRGTLDLYPVLHSYLSTLNRITDYAELRERRTSIREAAEQLGVAKRTAERYEARLKAAAQDDTRSEAA